MKIFFSLWWLAIYFDIWCDDPVWRMQRLFRAMLRWRGGDYGFEANWIPDSNGCLQWAFCAGAHRRSYHLVGPIQRSL